jgi:aldehyde dehydrogenase (NAD+)
MNSAAPSKSNAINTQDFQNIFEQHKAKSLKLRESTAKERIAKLNKLIAVVLKERKAIYQAGKDDFDKNEAEIDLTEIFAVVTEAKHTISQLKKWMKPTKVLPTLAMAGTSSYIKYEPKGTSLIISPWNYPLNLTLCPLVSAVAAGNCAIIKPSELTPNCSKVIANIISQIFDSNEVTVIEGEVNVATALLELPFEHIFYTGSPAVGKIVMTAAAKNLTSCTLELGGKSPTIIDENVDIKKAARNIMWGKCTNKGQTCIAPDYVFVHESQKEAFIQAAKKQVEQTFGQAIEQSVDYCRIVNERHFDRVKGLMDDAIEKGSKVEMGGKTDKAQRFIAPTLLSNISQDSRILEEEIFGPLLPIITFKHIDEVINHVNKNPKPLALYIYSKNQNNINKVINNTSSGGVCINHNMLQFLQMNLPFGGVNNSGIGSAHGKFGFDDFSHKRGVVIDRFSVIHWMFPPYTPTIKTLIKSSLKFLS